MCVASFNVKWLRWFLVVLATASLETWAQASATGPSKAVSTKVVPASKSSPNAAMVLLGRLIDKALPSELYSEKNVAWMGGKRSLVIQKQGAAVITSDQTAIAVRFPVRVTLDGNVDTSLVLVNIKSQCKAAFTMPATVTLTGNFAATPISVETAVALNVPPVSADCEGYAIAIAPLVQAIIEQQRPKWQAELQQEITAHLRALGL